MAKCLRKVWKGDTEGDGRVVTKLVTNQVCARR